MLNVAYRSCRELKNKPHRVFKAGPVFTDQGDFDLFTSQEEVGEQDQILAITSTTGQVTEVDLTQLSISERTSNGSFVNDTISDQEVFFSHYQIKEGVGPF